MLKIEKRFNTPSHLLSECVYGVILVFESVCIRYFLGETPKDKLSPALVLRAHQRAPSPLFQVAGPVGSDVALGVGPVGSDVRQARSEPDGVRSGARRGRVTFLPT